MAGEAEVHSMSLLAIPDYEQAIAEFVRQAVHDLMAALDPIYGSLRRLPLPEGVCAVRVEVGSSTTTSPEIHMAQEVEVQRSDVIEGNLEEFHNVLAQIAESHLPQFMRPFFEHVGDAAKAVGNTMDICGATLGWDDVLDASEKTEWAVDDKGMVHPPQVVAGPAVIAKLLEQPPTRQQQERAAEMMLRKQEEHVSRRRSRRLR